VDAVTLVQVDRSLFRGREVHVRKERVLRVRPLNVE